MTRRPAMSASDRRAMADAMRHMHHAGVRRIDLKQTSRLTHRQVHQAINTVLVLPAVAQTNRLPGRDDIAGPLTSGVVSPRHVSSPRVPGDDLPVDLAGRDGCTPVAPVIFPRSHGSQIGDGVEQSGAGECVDGVGHREVVALKSRAVIGNANGVLPCAR